MGKKGPVPGQAVQVGGTDLFISRCTQGRQGMLIGHDQQHVRIVLRIVDRIVYRQIPFTDLRIDPFHIISARGMGDFL